MQACCNSNFFTCGPFSLCVPFYSGGITDDNGGSQSQPSQSNLVDKFLHNAQVVSIGEINNLKHVTNWTVQSFMCVLPHLCFNTYCLPFLGVLLFDYWDSWQNHNWCSIELWQLSLLYHNIWSIQSRFNLLFLPKPNERHSSKVRPRIFFALIIWLHNWLHYQILLKLLWVPRYKLNVRMEHNGDKGNFLIWDATCIKMFDKTAAECRDELIAICSARCNDRLNDTVVCDWHKLISLCRLGTTSRCFHRVLMKYCLKLGLSDLSTVHNCANHLCWMSVKNPIIFKHWQPSLGWR